MKKPARLAVLTWALILCLCLSACDMAALSEGFMGGFGLFGEEATEAPTIVPTRPPVATLPPVPSTEATEEPTLPEPDPDLYWICAVGGLRVRTGPGQGYEAVGLLDDGTIVRPLRWSNGWAYIDFPLEGWCSGDYLYQLGWYGDVKMPRGTILKDDNLVGKWVHVTQPTGSGNQRKSRVGIYELTTDGTFTHSVAEYGVNADGKWELISGFTDRPQWVGEYQFDGEILTMNYMAFVDQTFSESGSLVSRVYLAAPYILEMSVSLSPDLLRLTVDNGEMIPCYPGYGTHPNTLATLYRASGSRDFPKDVCDALQKWFP